MPRPPRIEFAGAIYHLMSRGDRREPIFFILREGRTVFGVQLTLPSHFVAEQLRSACSVVTRCDSFRVCGQKQMVLAALPASAGTSRTTSS